MAVGPEPGRRGQLADGVGQASLNARWGVKIFDRTAAHADQVMVVAAGQLFGKFEASEVIAPHDPVHDPSLFEDGQVAVGGALRHAAAAGHQFRGGHRMIRRSQGLHQGLTAARVALIQMAKKDRGPGVKVVHARPA